MGKDEKGYRHRVSGTLALASWRAPEIRIGLFGSVVRGEAQPNSDVDVLVDIESG
jgi:predicted nucleotidyltransferase